MLSYRETVIWDNILKHDITINGIEHAFGRDVKKQIIARCGKVSNIFQNVLLSIIEITLIIYMPVTAQTLIT